MSASTVNVKSFENEFKKTVQQLKVLKT